MIKTIQRIIKKHFLIFLIKIANEFKKKLKQILFKKNHETFKMMMEKKKIFPLFEIFLP